MEKINGMVERIVFSNEDNGWSVFHIIKENQQKVVVQGKTFNLSEGLYLEIEGEYEKTKFGLQFKASKITASEPKTKDAIYQYLVQGPFEGIGKVLASKIVDTFPDDSLWDVLNNDPEKLLTVPGMSAKKLEDFKKVWQDNQKNHEDILFLEQHGFSYHQSQKILQTLKTNKTKLAENPYLLMEVPGLGFVSADRFALRLGFKKDDPQRILNGLTYVLKNAVNDGHTWLGYHQISEKLNYLLNIDIDDDILEFVLDKCAEVNVLKKIEFAGETVYSWMDVYLAEEYIYNRLQASKLKKMPMIPNLKQNIDDMALVKGINLSDEQYYAIENIMQLPCSILTGGAGVGKSTTVRLLVEMLMSRGIKIGMAAPTGRAAQRLQEVTSQDAITIHRLLKWSPEDHAFVHNEESPLSLDFVIIDESSMVDVFIFRDLLKAIKMETQILFIGDPNQLPSVGAGKVLHDIIALKLAPVFALTKTFRQDEDSFIVTNANKVIQGLPVDKFNFIDDPSLLGKKDFFFIPSVVTDQSQLNVLKRMNSLIRGNLSLISKNYKDPSDIHFNWNENRFKTITNDSTKEEKIAFLKSLVGKICPGHSLLQGWGSLEIIEELVLKIIPTYYKVKDTQILCPMRKGVLGTTNLNKLLQKIINPPSEEKTEFRVDKDNIFREGDKVIQTRNNYDLGIYNGDIGYITYITPGDAGHTDSGYKKNVKFKIKFPLVDDEVSLNRENLGDLELAYAITIHKSQGSEFPAVIIPLSYEMKNMLNQNLLYTAITRAKKVVILTGHNLALEAGYKNKQQDLRQSILSILK